MDARSPTKPGRVPAVRQALRVLRYLAGTEKPVSVSMVARGTELSPSTASTFSAHWRRKGSSRSTRSRRHTTRLGLLEIASPLVNRDDTVLVRPLLSVSQCKIMR